MAAATNLSATSSTASSSTTTTSVQEAVASTSTSEATAASTPILSSYVLNHVHEYVSPKLLGNMKGILADLLEMSGNNIVAHYNDLGVINLDKTTGKEVKWKANESCLNEARILRNSAKHPSGKVIWTDDDFRMVVKQYITAYHKDYPDPSSGVAGS